MQSNRVPKSAVSSMRAQIVWLFGVLWQDDNADLMPVLAPAFFEGGGIRCVSRQVQP